MHSGLRLGDALALELESPMPDGEHSPQEQNITPGPPSWEALSALLCGVHGCSWLH